MSDRIPIQTDTTIVSELGDGLSAEVSTPPAADTSTGHGLVCGLDIASSALRRLARGAP